MNTLSFLLFAPAGGDGQPGGGSQIFIIFGLMILIFYFFMIRPQQKKQKKIQNFRENLKKGDKIITIGGLHGKIIDVQESTFLIEVEDGVKLKIEKAAVAIDGNEIKK